MTITWSTPAANSRIKPSGRGRSFRALEKSHSEIFHAHNDKPDRMEHSQFSISPFQAVNGNFVGNIHQLYQAIFNHGSFFFANIAEQTYLSWSLTHFSGIFHHPNFFPRFQPVKRNGQRAYMCDINRHIPFFWHFKSNFYKIALGSGMCRFLCTCIRCFTLPVEISERKLGWWKKFPKNS